MFQAILWDLDGTIADSEELHYLSWREVMERKGVDYSYEEFLTGFGRSNPEVLRGYFGEDLPDEDVHWMGEGKEVAFRALLPGRLHLLPGVADWLNHFKQTGIPQMVASSAPTANITAMLTALELGDYFAAIVSGAHLPRGKPDPAIFLNSAAAVGARPASCLVMEDSSHGIEAAQRAGMASVAVGPRSEAILTNNVDPSGAPVLAVSQLTHLVWDDVMAMGRPG